MKPYPELTSHEITKLDLAECPDCSAGLLEGPCGGMCMNVKCANPHCGSRFNLIPGMRGEMGKERLSGVSPQATSVRQVPASSIAVQCGHARQVKPPKHWPWDQVYVAVYYKGRLEHTFGPCRRWAVWVGRLAMRLFTKTDPTERVEWRIIPKPPA